MKDKEILDLAKKHIQPIYRENDHLFEDGVFVHADEYWEFCTEKLIAFAKDLISQVRGL